MPSPHPDLPLAHMVSRPHAPQPDRSRASVYRGADGRARIDYLPDLCEGTLLTIDFGDQQPESRQVETFTCGHEVEGARLQTADADRLDVERRASDETVTPIDAEE